MSPSTRKEYTENIRQRYKKAEKKQKSRILDEFCKTCHYNRKYAIRLLNQKNARATTNHSKRGRKKKYTHYMIFDVLFHIWTLTNLPCSKRLKAMLPIWLPHYPVEIPENVYNDLISISAATIDRIMKPNRAKYQKSGLSTTKPGSIIKKQIPIATNQWDESRPGFIEADTVAHCGSSMAGAFTFTINCVDIATAWTEQFAVWGKGERGVLNGIENIENRLPFPILGFDCDNGSEFLNWHIVRHFLNRKKPVKFTRSRAYYKNDNAHIEEKNWTHIRQYLGYQRFDNIELVDLLNDVYSSEWRLYFNFFIPSVKLVDKIRKGAKTIKKYDPPKTPYQRILESPFIADEQKKELSALYETLNPFILQKSMKTKIRRILKIVNQNSLIDNSALAQKNTTE